MDIAAACATSRFCVYVTSLAHDRVFVFDVRARQRCPSSTTAREDREGLWCLATASRFSHLHEVEPPIAPRRTTTVGRDSDGGVAVRASAKREALSASECEISGRCVRVLVFLCVIQHVWSVFRGLDAVRVS